MRPILLSAVLCSFLLGNFVVGWVVECVVGGLGCQETPSAIVSMESESFKGPK